MPEWQELGPPEQVNADNEAALYEQSYRLVYPMAPLQYMQFNTTLPLPRHLPLQTKQPQEPDNSEEIVLNFLSLNDSTIEPAGKVAFHMLPDSS